MANKETHLRVLERRKNVAARYLRGEPQWQIAQSFEVDQGTISRDLAAIQALWERDATQALSARKARELAKIDAVEADAWRAWKRSQEDGIVLESGKRAKFTFKRELRKACAGDPRFLELVLRCVQRRCEICGIELIAAGAGIIVQAIEGLREEDITGIAPDTSVDSAAPALPSPAGGEGEDTSPDVDPAQEDVT